MLRLDLVSIKSKQFECCVKIIKSNIQLTCTKYRTCCEYRACWNATRENTGSHHCHMVPRPRAVYGPHSAYTTGYGTRTASSLLGSWKYFRNEWVFPPSGRACDMALRRAAIDLICTWLVRCFWKSDCGVLTGFAGWACDGGQGLMGLGLGRPRMGSHQLWNRLSCLCLWFWSGFWACSLVTTEVWLESEIKQV